jgi:regulator of sirC expression with transglutaminase-like and TPR domain
VLDPFQGAQVCDAARLRELLKAGAGPDAELAPEHYAAVPSRAVLLRLQNNIKLRRLQAGDVQGAFAIVERMTWIAPQLPELLREAALMQGQLGNLGAALRALERYIAAEPDERARHRAAVLLQELRGKLH